MPRVLLVLILFLAGAVIDVARASDVSCYQNLMSAVASREAFLKSSWGTYSRASAIVISNAGTSGGVTQWAADWDFRYGPNNLSGHASVLANCPAGEDPNKGSPQGQCALTPPLNGAFSGNLHAGSLMCQGTDGGSGCSMSFTPDSDPFMNRTGTKWATHGTYKPTGATCTPGPIKEGDPNSPASPEPSRTCGGVSCHDSAANNDCTSTPNGDLCRPTPKLGTAGGCSSLGDNTLCSGTPSAPTPPPPPVSPISDPGHEIKGTDDYTYSSGGGNFTVVVTTYGAGQAPSSSGQKSGDDGPAPASSTGAPKGDGTTASGGGDCNSPPVVNGSGGLNAVAYQTWKTRCAVEGSKLGTGTVNSLGELYTPSTDTTASVVADFQAKVQQAPVANAVSGFFQVGTVGGSCPVWTLPASEWLPAQTFDFYCRGELQDLLDMARVVVVIACAYMAFRIAMGDS